MKAIKRETLRQREDWVVDLEWFNDATSCGEWSTSQCVVTENAPWAC